MKSAELVLAIDCGTQSLKAIAFDLAGAMRAKAQVAYAPYASPHPGWAWAHSAWVAMPAGSAHDDHDS